MVTLNMYFFFLTWCGCNKSGKPEKIMETLSTWGLSLFPMVLAFQEFNWILQHLWGPVMKVMQYVTVWNIPNFSYAKKKKVHTSLLEFQHKYCCLSSFNLLPRVFQRPANVKLVQYRMNQPPWPMFQQGVAC